MPDQSQQSEPTQQQQSESSQQSQSVSETDSGLVVVTQPGQGQGDAQAVESVSEPAKVMRIGAMVRQLLEEVRRAPLDDAGRARLREIYEMSIKELAEGLSPELREELAQFAMPFEADAPSEAELRVAQAQLVGWLEGLFHGIQATLFAQQMAARSQLEELQRRGLPPGPQDRGSDRPGTYL
ncbi:MAG TPA: bacterial proteasome activator family protein [Acidimicrobiia bacterium]|nr:bacterial proteasome activator family protein [Acidimicrobiia bacterium]